MALRRKECYPTGTPSRRRLRRWRERLRRRCPLSAEKLKLTGEPYKIFKNTAFIKGMFNSDLEVAKAAH